MDRSRFSTLSSLRPLAVIGGTIALAACGGDCVIPPCVAPFAVDLSVTSAANGAPLTTAFVQLLDSAGTIINMFQCSGNCLVPGVGGTYRLVIGAPGYQNARRTVVVETAETPKCGCPANNPQQVSVALQAGS